MVAIVGPAMGIVFWVGVGRPAMDGGFVVIGWQVREGVFGRVVGRYANDFWCNQTLKNVFHVIFWLYNRKPIIFPENVFD